MPSSEELIFVQGMYFAYHLMLLILNVRCHKGVVEATIDQVHILLLFLFFLLQTLAWIAFSANSLLRIYSMLSGCPVAVKGI